jgi:hypothetical protein
VGEGWEGRVGERAPFRVFFCLIEGIKSKNFMREFAVAKEFRRFGLMGLT